MTQIVDEHQLDELLNDVLGHVQFAREQLEVVYEDGNMPPRLSRSHERLEQAAVALLNYPALVTTDD